MKISIIIPALNASGTLTKTLQSLSSQTFIDWEAIIIDDGSTDGTVNVATDFAEQDSRIRIVRQPQSGVSAARNRGIGLAQFDWLLFLDSDDWIAPTHLETLTNLLEADFKLDAAYCGWIRVTAEGQHVGEGLCAQNDNLFVEFTQTNKFAIHACIVRRSLIQAVGGFDPSLQTCEDWDLWQRISRTGIRFGRTPEVLAYYRMQPSSASVNAWQILKDGLEVISRGHASDSRVPDPSLAYACGAPIEQLSGAKLRFACWCAGLAIGSSNDAHLLLEVLQDIKDPGLNPKQLAEYLFSAVPLPTCCPLVGWDALWLDYKDQINHFLAALEAQSTAFELAKRVWLHLERLIVRQVKKFPLLIGNTYAARIEITAPIADIVAPAPAERLWCLVELEGEIIGEIDLPICNGVVFGYVLTDAIGVRFAWLILDYFFQRTVYKNLSIQHSQDGLSVHRGTLCLAEGLPEDKPLWQQIHNRVGWAVFLQEIWACPDWALGDFYNSETRDPNDDKLAQTSTSNLTVFRHEKSDWLLVEVSDEFPDISDIKAFGDTLHVVLTVGGTAIGVFPISTNQERISVQQFRAKLTSESGFELCCAAVREGLLGQPMTDQVTLRSRLAEMASLQRQRANSGLETLIPNLVSRLPSELNSLLSSGRAVALLSHRTQESIGTNISRRAALPVEAVHEVIDAAVVSGEAVVYIPSPTTQPQHLLYTPDLILSLSQPKLETSQMEQASHIACERNTIIYDRSYFETTFAKGPDRWDYNNPYEQTKYQQTLSLLPSGQIKRAVELACAEGHFTIQLASRVKHLTASDFSQIALDQAAERCHGLKNIDFLRLDLVNDPLPGQFNLIVCSEVLYFVGEREKLKSVGFKLAQALEPGGYLLTAHANIIIDDPDSAGFDWNFPYGAKVIGETLAEIPNLNLVKELKTPLYRIQLFQKKPLFQLSLGRSHPEIIEMSQPAPPPLEVTADVRWHGGEPAQSNPDLTVSTAQLPILMYHRIAPTGSSETNRWRVTPKAFEEQLRYLRDSGFYSITLEEWRRAMAAKQPLPGRAVLITFDDGYLDFFTYAQPLLKQYGFSATVFLVADKVGQSNSWDKFYGEELPLLNWQQIHQLQAEGIEFGSHSASHHPLTGLSLAEIVKEGARSRAILQRELQVPIRAFAYPYGDTDAIVEHLIGACGYSFGLTCQSGHSHLNNSLLSLPRIEVMGSDRFQAFVKKLSL